MLLLDDKQKVEELKKISQKLKRRQRVICSDECNLTSPNQMGNESNTYKKSSKPNGVWFGHGNSWLRYLLIEMELERKSAWAWGRKRLLGIRGIFELKLNLPKILRIRNTKEFEAFEDRFANKHKEWINWEKVEKYWDGIEIRYLARKAKWSNSDTPSFWYDGWDVSGGAIWNNQSIKKIELLACCEPHWELNIKLA